MANFDAKVQVDVVTSGAERALRKIERNVNRIEDKSREILSVDKQLLRQRKQLIGLSGDQAKKAQNNVKLLTLQRRELQLQKTELSQINRLEKQRASSLTRSTSGGGSTGGVVAVPACWQVVLVAFLQLDHSAPPRCSNRASTPANWWPSARASINSSMASVKRCSVPGRNWPPRLRNTEPRSPSSAC